MALIEPDNWHGKKLPKADQLTKELKEGWMSSPPENYTINWHRNNHLMREPCIQSSQMEFGTLKGQPTEEIIVT
eukprot:7728772-Heterocapsa_arctica.AAC.1